MIKKFMIVTLRNLMEEELDNPLGGNKMKLVIHLGDGTKGVIRIKQI